MPPEFVDPLEWYRQDFRNASIRGDERQQELARIFDLVAANQRPDLQKAIGYLQTGQRLAIERHQPFWELLYDYLALYLFGALLWAMWMRRCVSF